MKRGDEEFQLEELPGSIFLFVDQQLFWILALFVDQLFASLLSLFYNWVLLLMLVLLEPRKNYHLTEKT